MALPPLMRSCCSRCLRRSCLLVAVAAAAPAALRAQTLPDTLPPMPTVPDPLPPGSVKLGDPKDFPEMKLDFPIAAGPFEPTWDSIASHHPGEVAWLREAKFGIWVHFGPQAAGRSGDWYARRLYQPGEQAYANHIRDYGHPSVTGYMDVLHAWNPVRLDPAKLVQAYHDAGARFLIVQAVHHDNFDNWNSRYQPWNSVHLGPHRDLLGEWSRACRQARMRYGFAFHHEYAWWWYQPAFAGDKTGNKAGVPYDGRLTLADGKGQWWEGCDPRLLYTINLREYEGMDSFKTSMPQGIFARHQAFGRWYATQWALRILDAIDQYDPDFVYTDGNSTQPFSGYKSGSGLKADAHPRLLASYFNRTLDKHGRIDTFSITKFHPPANGIVSTAEGSFPARAKTDQPWIGENAVGDWFYAPGFTYDAGAVVRCLLEYVSRDGNYVVCISLQPDGSLDDGSRAMLQEIGRWLSVNGEGIYGSHAWKILGEGGDGKIRLLPRGQLGRTQAQFAFTPQDFRFTVGSNGALYAYCLTVPPAGSQVKIASLGTGAANRDTPVKSVSLLGSDAALMWRQTPEGLVIQCPPDMPFQIAVGFKIE